MEFTELTGPLLRFSLTGIFLVIFHAVISIIFPPWNFPRNIPTIPFYVSFLGAFTTMDQKDIYDVYLREKLERFGAVKIYFASRWNILVTDPKLLLQIFKEDDTFAKSGNQEKIPYSVLAEYTGENVISSHGDNWKLYRSVVTHGLQFPDCSTLSNNSSRVIESISKEVDNGRTTFAISDLIQRYCLSNVGQAMLGTNFDSEKNSVVHEKVKEIKRQIFRPLFMNFPFLDKIPIPSRQRARRSVQNFRNYLSGLVKSSQLGRDANTSSAGYSLFTALDTQILTEKQFTDNCVIVMVAGHENPLLFISSLLYVLAKYPNVQEKVRQELDDENDSMPYLTSVLYETLRMYPPLGQIINRRTTKKVSLGGRINIPKGVYIGYNNFATGRSKSVWGEDADEFKPERWGTGLLEISRHYSSYKSSARLPTFHGRKRACLGEKFALLETKLLICQLVKQFHLSLGAHWADRLTSAGPVSPLMLSIEFTKK